MAFKNSFDIDLLEMQVSFKLMHACLIANKIYNSLHIKGYSGKGAK